MPGHEPPSAEEFWRGRLKQAEDQYRTATGEARNTARREYLRVLRIFTDLVIRGKEPRAGKRHS